MQVFAQRTIEGFPSLLVHADDLPKDRDTGCQFCPLLSARLASSGHLGGCRLTCETTARDLGLGAPGSFFWYSPAFYELNKE